MTTPPPARRRSCLTVPGGSEKMLHKAISLDADEIVLDLEDAVAPAAKAEARRLVTDILTTDAFAGRLVSVRVNAADTPWHADDMAALAALPQPPASIILPKIDTPAALAAIACPPSIGLQVLIETAAGLANCLAIAADPRLVALIIGYGDLASSLGRDSDADWRYVQESVLIAARAHGLQAIDGPCFELGPDSAQLSRDSAATAAMGFDGKWAIHPAQLVIINAAYGASAAAVTRARGILAALDRSAADGLGVAVYEGAMVDEAMRLGALRILARAGEPT